MKKTIKYPALLLAILLILICTVTTVSAAPDDGSTLDEPEPATTVSDVTENPVEETEPIDEPVDPTPYYPEYPGDYDPHYDGSGDAGSVKDANQLTDAKAPDKDAIAPIQWTNITIDEEAAKANNNADVNFYEIKQSSNSTSDDGGWLLWIGYGLLALALLLILYFIVATVNAKKQAERDRRHNSGSRGSGSSGGSHTADRTAARASDDRSGGHYADGYESTSRRASKANTGEVYVPRRATK